MTEYRIGFSRRRHLLAWAIRAATDSEASHCYVRRIEGDADLVLEASGGHGVWVTTYAELLSRRGTTLLAEYRLQEFGPDDLDRAWQSTPSDYGGHPYGWGQLVGDWWCLATGARRNPLASTAVVCSELVLRYLRRAGLDVILHLQRLRAETVTPEDLWQQLDVRCDLVAGRRR